MVECRSLNRRFISRRLEAVLLTGVMLCAVSAPAYSADPKPPLLDFGVVTPRLWRGGVPDESGLKYLAAHHFKTIIDLRALSSKKERIEATQLGMKYIWLPMTIFMFPSKETVNKFFSIVDNPGNGKIYMHCLAGGDRTGILVALYRMVRQRWSYNRVHAEMAAFHFRPWLTTFLQTVAQSNELYPNLAAREGQ